MTRLILAALPGAAVTAVPGHGHDMVDSAPDLVVSALAPFLS